MQSAMQKNQCRSILLLINENMEYCVILICCFHVPKIISIIELFKYSY